MGNSVTEPLGNYATVDIHDMSDLTPPSPANKHRTQYFLFNCFTTYSPFDADTRRACCLWRARNRDVPNRSNRVMNVLYAQRRSVLKDDDSRSATRFQAACSVHLLQRALIDSFRLDAYCSEHGLKQGEHLSQPLSATLVPRCRR